MPGYILKLFSFGGKISNQVSEVFKSEMSEDAIEFSRDFTFISFRRIAIIIRKLTAIILIAVEWLGLDDVRNQRVSTPRVIWDVRYLWMIAESITFREGNISTRFRLAIIKGVDEIAVLLDEPLLIFRSNLFPLFDVRDGLISWIPWLFLVKTLLTKVVLIYWWLLFKAVFWKGPHGGGNYVLFPYFHLGSDFFFKFVIKIFDGIGKKLPDFYQF